MISLLLAAGIQTGPTLLFKQLPEADRVVFEAIVRTPAVGPRDELALMAVADGLRNGTEDYSAAQLRRWTSQTGSPLRIERMPGFVRIGITMPKGQSATGISMLDSLLRRGQWPKEFLDSWTVAHRGNLDDYWNAALFPSLPRARDLRRTDVADAYLRFFRPESTTIAIYGAISTLDESNLRDRMALWKPARPKIAPMDGNSTRPILNNRTRISTVEICSPSFRLDDPTFASKVLASFALGVGRGSSLFRIMRTEDGFGYRQEALLWPAPEGWTLRLIVATYQDSIDVSAMGAWRDQLLKDVATWNETHRGRAIGAARAALILQIGPQPFSLGGADPIRGSLEDETVMSAYWLSCTQRPWDPAGFVQSLEQVDLVQLKTAAEWLLAQANTRTILGLGKG